MEGKNMGCFRAYLGGRVSFFRQVTMPHCFDSPLPYTGRFRCRFPLFFPLKESFMILQPWQTASPGEDRVRFRSGHPVPSTLSRTAKVRLLYIRFGFRTSISSNQKLDRFFHNAIILSVHHIKQGATASRNKTGA